MLTQAKADELLAAYKKLEEGDGIKFPQIGRSLLLKAKAISSEETFLIDVNRKCHRINIRKCTYQERFQGVDILLRLDIEGSHTNPDGTDVPSPHLHIYREEYGDAWAVPLADLPGKPFTNTTDLVTTLREFLAYCKIQNIPLIDGGLLE